ncbi:MAG: response regulator [Actinomycetota bacterium]|nr:response regulator [Actinomycetota bacterium]
MALVLVVEDQPSIRTVVRFHLQSEGHQAVFAEDVEEGWRVLLKERPAAAVVDIRLPGADGWTLIERVRADETFSKLPIVVVTGLKEPGVVERAEALGCDYLSKPFAASALVAKLQANLRSTEPPKRAPVTAGMGRVRVQMVATRVVLLLERYQIEGAVYLPPEMDRFSDAWESVMRDQRTFVPVTDARITTFDGGQVLGNPGFAEVRKLDIQAVFPWDAVAE